VSALVLADAAVFRRAPCMGRHELFDPATEREDPDAVAERHTRALAPCDRCTCLTPCRELAASIPASTRAGVWAGMVHTPDRTISSTRRTPESAGR